MQMSWYSYLHINGLQNMVDITKSFFENLGLKISVNIVEPENSKTECVAFGTKRDASFCIKLSDFEIPWADMYKHLGHILYRDGSLNRDVDKKDYFYWLIF